MEKSYMERMHDGNYKCARVSLRVAAVLFTLFVIVCVAVGVTLIVTQQPVDLHGTSDRFSEGTRSTLSPLRSRKKPTYRKFTYEDLSSTAPILKFNYHRAFLPDGSALLLAPGRGSNEGDTLNIIPVGSKEETTFIHESQFMNGFGSDRIKFSSSGKYAALYKFVHHGFRWSREAVYQISRVVNGKFQKMYNVGPIGTGKEIVQEFTWNPSNESDSFVFVNGFSLYYQEDPEKEGSAKQLSMNGSEFVHYGIADWLYEEDVFANSVGHWWAPSGQRLAYIKFDDQDVNKVFIKKYHPNLQYPEYKSIPYPKAGVKEQPKVKLYLWNRQTHTRVVISPPQELANKSYYIFAASWLKASDTRDERLLTVWSDRRQLNLYFTLCNETDCVMSFSQSFVIGKRKLWAHPQDIQELYSTATGFITLLPVSYTDGNIYNHIVHVKVEKEGAGAVSASHGGNYDVSQILGFDPLTDTITYAATGAAMGSMRVYRVTNASSQTGHVACISCEIEDCDHANAIVSPTGTRALVICKFPFKDAELHLLDVFDPIHGRRKLRGKGTTNLSFDPPSFTIESVPLPSGIEAHVGLLVPPQIDPTVKYPLLLHVYGGPVTYANTMETPWDFLLYLCSSQQMIIAYVDGRGSAYRGWRLKEDVVENLGIPETEDQIDAVREIVKRYSFIDENAITVFGWSFGGFLASHVAVRDRGEHFRCALAVAPVADFSLYDSAYTERYLGFPEENPTGYNNSRLVDKIHMIGNVSYLLAHGEADDNVHYQHSALLAEALQSHNIHFTQLVYTNQDHAMTTMRHHLYKEVVRFLEENCMGR